VPCKVDKNLGELIKISVISSEKQTISFWKAKDNDDLAPFGEMQEKYLEVSHGNLEIETRDSTEKNAGSNEESENEQPLLQNANSINSEAENNGGDQLNTTNEI